MSGSSKRWLAEHANDFYVKKARQDGYVSRAAYKLLELQQKDRFLKSGMTVVDLGAAPGGWSQVASEIVGRNGHVIALDLLPMTPPMGVDFIQGDFGEASTLEHLREKLLSLNPTGQVNVVLSDMMPNVSGQVSVDQPRSLALVELAADCATQFLSGGGCFVSKVFQGSGVDVLIRQLREQFKTVRIRKPTASRSRSREIYLVALGFDKK